ncbi:MAG: hypothetical protein IPL79_06380 [Myxococcales bacterium]|nr:hypothetical protein [Myxococcales bacterium]
MAHNWFGGLIATNETTSPWLDEGINDWLDTIVMDELYGASGSGVVGTAAAPARLPCTARSRAPRRARRRQPRPGPPPAPTPIPTTTAAAPTKKRPSRLPRSSATLAARASWHFWRRGRRTPRSRIQPRTNFYHARGLC